MHALKDPCEGGSNASCIYLSKSQLRSWCVKIQQVHLSMTDQAITNASRSPEIRLSNTSGISRGIRMPRASVKPITILANRARISSARENSDICSKSPMFVPDYHVGPQAKPNHTPRPRQYDTCVRPSFQVHRPHSPQSNS